MSRLRDSSVAFARTGAHRLLSIERLFATERIAAGLEARRIGQAEPFAELVERTADKGVAGLSVADLRRLLAGIWTDRSRARLAGTIVDHALGVARRSVDRALVAAYLLDYPVDHSAFEALRAAAAVAAERHIWSWRDAGRAWRLWDGPALLGDALRDADDATLLLREAGFVGRLVDGAFVSAARADAARSMR
jgi:hypothetical protein